MIIVQKRNLYSLGRQNKVFRARRLKMEQYQIIRGHQFPNVQWYKKENIENTLDYQPRNGDIIITSFPKTGSNWLLYIVLQITSKGKCFPSFNDCVYNKVPSMEITGLQVIDNMKGLRIYRNHYRYDIVKKNPNSKVLYIYRNPEDTLISYYHFIKSVREEQIEFYEFFEWFLNGSLGYGSYFDHVLTYLSHKDDDNLLLVSYENLHSTRKEEILRIAKFLGEEFYQCLSDDESVLENVIKHTSFDYMKKNLVMTFPHSKPTEGSTTESEHVINFFRKGTVGEGKTSLSLNQIKRLQKKVAETMKGTEIFREWTNN